MGVANNHHYQCPCILTFSLDAKHIGKEQPEKQTNHIQYNASHQ